LDEKLSQDEGTASGEAAVLCGLSLLAYKHLRAKKLLFVSAAFGLFSVQAIISRLDIFLPEILELLLAFMTFAALTFFFFSIVWREKIRIRTEQR
jgi:hypothetical protein